MRHFRKNRPIHEVKVPLTSLIDIVFLLLIYFLLTTNFLIDEGIKINLPQANASAPQLDKEITIYVNGSGQTFIGKEKVNIGDLFDQLRTVLGGKPDMLVVIRADRSVIVNKVVRVMDICKAAGAGRLCLATEKKL